jgi:hypothetical protein
MKVSLSMTFERKSALRIIEQTLGPVSEHISRMFVHAPSHWDEKWIGDIETFFPRIFAVATNVSGAKKKRLPVETLAEKFSDAFSVAAADVGKIYRDDAYATMKKAGKQREVQEAARDVLNPRLRAISMQLAKIVLSGESLDGSFEIARLIGDTVLAVRTENFGHA